MKRLALILAGVAVAGGVAATPAVAGLAGNPSFSHEISVPVPSAAKTPLFADDHSRDGATVPASATAQPGDDRGGVSRHRKSTQSRIISPEIGCVKSLEVLDGCCETVSSDTFCPD